MYNFFVESSQIHNLEVIITGSDVNHIKNVLRMKIGEEISVSNGVDNMEYRCGIEKILEEEIICRIRFVKEDAIELPSKLFLFQGLPKAEKMEFIIQKAVELGVYEVIPVSAKRSVVKFDEKKAKNRIVRWQGIAEAAAKQSKRRIIPKVCDIMTIKEAIQYAKLMDVRLIPYELAEGMEKTKNIIEAVRPGQSIAIFIGPEGGFEETEIMEAINAGIDPITMGRRILRTETAGLTMLSWIMYHLEA